jgi:hypothetical protein
MATNELVRYQDAAVPLTAAAASQADNYSAQTALYATHQRIHALQEALTGASVDGKSGNTIVFTRTAANGGEYESLQAAVDAASSGDVVVVGAGSWGEVVLKGGISLVGLQPPLADDVVLSKLTFAPSSGGAVANTVYVSNLRISSNSDASSLVLGSASAPVRVTMSGVRVYRNNAAATTAMVSCSGNVADTSIYMKDCMFTHEGGQVASSITLLSSSARYLDLVACQFSEGGRCLDVTAGTTGASLCRFETASTISCVKVAAASTLALGNSLVRNLGTNSSGIELVNAGTSVCAVSDTVFDVSAGTGKVVLGSGVLAKNNITVQPAALGARNTSITAVTVTQLAFQVPA